MVRRLLLTVNVVLLNYQVLGIFITKLMYT